MSDTDIVVGGGISGLLAAMIVAKRGGRRVVVVEREPQAGGLLGRFDYGREGIFDRGMHNMYETGIAELDGLLFGLLPACDWQLLEGNRRDLAGVFFNGVMQRNSPYPDLRSLPGARWDRCLAGLFRQIESGEPHRADNAWEDARTRLGRPIAEIVDVALRKQFGRAADELDPFAARLTTLSRVVMFGEEAFTGIIDSPVLRDRLAWPEQRTLPTKWQSGRKAYYPRRYGIHQVIDVMLSRLRDAGVEVLLGSSLKALEREHGLIRNAVIEQGGVSRPIGPVERLIWTTGIPALAHLLGVDRPAVAFDPPRRTVVVNLLLERPPGMEDLFYLYCYEPGCHTFRVTNFAGYCDGARREGGWPVSVELLLDPPIPSPEAIGRIALSELERFGVIGSASEARFIAVEPLASGFPMPTTVNFTGLAALRDRVRAVGVRNLVPLGILSEPGVFFQRDVLAQTWNTLTGEETVHA